MLRFPNFNKSIINISATFADFLRVGTEHKPLKVLQKELCKNYKNVVFICFDGLGIHPMKINLDKKSFLFKNLKTKLTSVFPSTTTNATTSLISAKAPIEHGWFAWSLFFEEINQVIDIYLSSNHYTGEKIDPNFVWSKLSHDAYFNKSNSEFNINTVFPPFVKGINSSNNFYFDNLEEQFKILNKITKQEGKQFIYSYSPLPDSIMHDFGVSSVQAKQVIQKINSFSEDFVAKNPDTLLVISADHGQIDVSDYILIYNDKKFLSFLETLPFGEARAMFVKLKRGCQKEFKKYITQVYGKDIKLFKVEYLIKKGVFGNGEKYKKLLGDYILVIKNHKQFVFAEKDNLFKGHHTGLTEEMFVPLIIA